MDKVIAFSYNKDKKAPHLISKGKGDIARRILKIAEENNISIISDSDLCNSLFDLNQGDFIPEEYYLVFSEILAFVYSLRKE